MTLPPRLLLPALLLLAGASPAAAQNEPFRIVNRSPLPATALHVMPTGGTAWSANLLNRGPLAPGAIFSLRPGEGAGCRFDVRLVLQDGRDVLRRDADICAERSVEIAPPREDAAAPAATPR